MCQILQVSSSGFYAWRGAPEGRRSAANRALLGKIVHIHQQSLFEWIEVFYNRQRRHSYLDYMTPDEYERYTVVANP